MAALSRLATLLCLASLLSLLPLDEAKLQSAQVRLKGPRLQNRWKYISKFGYSLGTGTFGVRLQLRRPKNVATEGKVSLEVYLDEDWKRVEAIEDVCERPRHARKVQNITVPPSGEWGEWTNDTLSQWIRPHIWYFVISDCNDSLPNLTHSVRFEFHGLQDGGSEFSVEMRGMLPAHLLFVTGFAVFVLRFYRKTVAFSRSAGSVHPVIWILSSVVILHFLALLLHTLHLLVYRSNGVGLVALDVLSEIFFALSQVTQTSLLILIALGYTLLQSCIGELDLMIPVCFMVGVIHVMLVGFGKLKDDSAYAFHENEGVLGWILLVLRLLLYVWFLWAVQSSASESGSRMRGFLAKFRAMGSLYFLSYPLIFLVTKCFAPYLQNGVMTVGLEAMQAASSVWLSVLFLDRGEYFKVSTLSASELPGGSKFGVVKEE
uniref:GPR180/TMEM145 transmembrane domain-containing protein n=1 Tax=Alexandrium monilatum TaxID=311494 RepID=A0A7S4VID5_9DINO